MEKKLLQEIKFMMERIESPRMTYTQYESNRENLLAEDMMIYFQEGRKIKDSFNRLLSDIGSSQFVKLSQKSLNALENIGREINKLKS